ncbi:MAG TPA: hypothetical protein VFX98_08995 [Longimicrobiaceae bacterium]|nr:hypothetical protein [Longimicrobiaceae bacterium]
MSRPAPNPAPPALRRPRRALRALLAGAALLAAQGCYHYQTVVVDPQPATPYTTRRVSSLFWGLVQPNIPASNCLDNVLDEVKVSTNFGYLLLSVATLGIWVPVDVQWRCSALPGPGGPLQLPPPPPPPAPSGR